MARQPFIRRDFFQGIPLVSGAFRFPDGVQDLLLLDGQTLTRLHLTWQLLHVFQTGDTLAPADPIIVAVQFSSGNPPPFPPNPMNFPSDPSIIYWQKRFPHPFGSDVFNAGDFIIVGDQNDNVADIKSQRRPEQGEQGALTFSWNTGGNQLDWAPSVGYSAVILSTM